MEYQDVTHEIIGAAYAVHKVLGAGFLEKVYENALAIELRKRGFEVVQQTPINVFYHDQVVGELCRPHGKRLYHHRTKGGRQSRART